MKHKLVIADNFSSVNLECLPYIRFSFDFQVIDKESTLKK